MKGMVNMKDVNKCLSLLLALCLLLTAFSLPALAEGGAPAEGAPLDPYELIVGSPTPLKGDFFTEMFGNNTADFDVRTLLHGYNLIHWDEDQGVYLFDESVVENAITSVDDVGNKTYYIVIYDDLRYSDGTPITAWDYAFSLLMMMSPQIAQIGGKPCRAEYILGGEAYLAGEAPYLAGVGVLDEHQLAITLDHDFLPYFFEIGLLMCVPYPISEIAPGCKVMSDGQQDFGDGYGYGAYIANIDPEIEAPLYTTGLLRETILDPETGYNSHPRVVSGPYTLASFDGTTAHFEKNPCFKGVLFKEKARGTEPNGVEVTNGTTVLRDYSPEQSLQKPSIERIAFTHANYDTLVEDLEKGRLDLVNKVGYVPVIDRGLKTKLNNTPYPRVGLSFMAFSFEKPTVREKEVRQAIAWCMNRDGLTSDYCGRFGTRVDGWYGIEQWEYLLATQKIDYPINFDDEQLREDTHNYYPNTDGVHLHTEEDYKLERRKWEELTLDNLTFYQVDTEKANRMLDKAGWTLNRDGGEYNPKADDVRCKRIDGELVALDLTMMYAEGNHIADHFQRYVTDHLNRCGIHLTLVPAPMDEVLLSYYRVKERTTDMVYMATNSQSVVDPTVTYGADATADHKLWDAAFTDDEELYWRAVGMRRTDPKDTYDYVARWIAFQERYNEVLPAIPIYSNICYDFYADALSDYDITAHVTWAQAILEAQFTCRTERIRLAEEAAGNQ